MEDAYGPDGPLLTRTVGAKHPEDDMTQAERFHERFAGLARAHGQYRERGTEGGDKVEGQARTVREPATVESWEGHLKGSVGLGIVPVRDDATAVFGAIDVDEYNLDLEALAADVEKRELPLILCRSKSGGGHLFLFMKEPASAELVRTKLMEWAVALGHSGVEVFPKQVSLASRNDIGNWINMPYFAGDETVRYAIYGGKRLDTEGFLELSDLMAQTPASLEEITAPVPKVVRNLFEEAPPCLQSLASRGFGKGSRNNGLFNVGVYLRKRYGDEEWEPKLDKYNQEFMDPPLGHKEVSQVVRSVNRKKYEYMCDDQPIAPVCNRQICLTRKWGVGGGDGDPGVVFGDIVKIDSDPPVWIWDVDGARMELTTAELKDQGRFHSRAMEILNKWPHQIKPKAWATLVREKLQNAEIIEAPPDASPEGQLWMYLQEYCTGGAQARSRDELLQNKPWTEDGRTYFNGPHFKSYLEQQRIRITSHKMWAWLRDRGAEHHFFNIKGRGINCWSVPAFTEQSEDFDIPSIEDEAEEM